MEMKLFNIHKIKQVNDRNEWTMMTALQTLLLVLLHYRFKTGKVKQKFFRQLTMTEHLSPTNNAKYPT